MPGWNLKKGILLADKVSCDEYWSLLNYVFSDFCKKTNTYKFGLIKSICDQIYNLVWDELIQGYPLSYQDIFMKFTENYWNLVNKYELRQMAYNGKSEFSKIETILREAVQKYDIPSEVTFQALDASKRNAIVKAVMTECKKCVIGALYNDFEGKLYSFDLKKEGIVISESAYDYISKYKIEIERMNYYSWARFLEKINDDNALVRVLEKLDLSTPKRKDLSIYRELLFYEFQENNCFYCGKKLNDRMHVDHFIPWNFMKTDNLWNFVLACPQCNIKKSGSLVSMEYVCKLEMANSARLENVREQVVKKEFQAYKKETLERIWTYAKMSGIRQSDRL